MCRMACFACSVLLLSAAVAGADEAEDAFQTLFGAEYKKATATPDKADDVALAAKLLAAAKSKDTVPALAALLCEKAYELGVKAPAGYATAAAAMELLADKAPDKAAACREKILTIRQREYEVAKGPERQKAGAALLDALLAAADASESGSGATEAGTLLRRALALVQAVVPDRKAEVQDRIERVGALQKMLKHVADLKVRVAANPQDTAARKELVRLLLVDLDDPVQAVTFLDDSVEESLRKYAPAVAKGIEAAPEAACMELANWYLGLADTAGAAGKRAMLARAYAYYKRYLDLHKTEDVARSQAALALKKVDETLAKLGGGKADGNTPGPWFDLMRLADPAKYAVAGKWEPKGGTLVQNGSGYCRFILPCVPQGNYEIAVTCVYPGKNRNLGLLLPVGPTLVKCQISPSGGELFKTKTEPERMSSSPIPQDQDQVFSVKVLMQGEEAEISASLNDKPYLHWKGPLADLSTEAGDQLPVPAVPGLYTNWTAVTVKAVKIRMLSGKLKLLR